VVPRGFVPQLDKDYLISFAQLPTGATLDRSEMSCGRWSRLPEKSPGREVHGRLPRAVDITGFTNSSSAGHFCLFCCLLPRIGQNKGVICRPRSLPFASKEIRRY